MDSDITYVKKKFLLLHNLQKLFQELGMLFSGQIQMDKSFYEQIAGYVSP